MFKYNFKFEHDQDQVGGVTEYRFAVEEWKLWWDKYIKVGYQLKGRNVSKKKKVKI